MKNKNPKHYLTLLIGLFFCTELMGSDLTLSVGNLCEYMGKIQTDASGGTNTCSFNPYMASSLDYPLTANFFLSPQLGLSLPKSGADKNMKSMHIVALLNTKYRTGYVNLIGGLGLFITRMWGPGGDAELNNGTGTDSFPMPKEAVYARNLILNLGADFDFNQNWSAEIRTYVFNLTTSEDRAFSLGIHGTYHFGDVL